MPDISYRLFVIWACITVQKQLHYRVVIAAFCFSQGRTSKLAKTMQKNICKRNIKQNTQVLREDCRYTTQTPYVKNPLRGIRFKII